MAGKNLKTEILRTLVVVGVVLIIGFSLTACQTSVPLNKVALPTDKALITTENKDEFAYPTKDPSVIDGQLLFESNCAQCHGFANGNMAGHNFTQEYINKISPQDLFKATTAKHSDLAKKIPIKERWDIVMYIRYQLFGLPANVEDIKTKFGGNCAVCHGTRGFADGSLQYWLNPPPANFNQFNRLYDRTDEKLFKEIKYGIPWTAMPPWGGNHDHDKNFDFDDEFIWELVKYVRHFGYSSEADVLRDKNLFEGKKPASYKETDSDGGK